MFCRTSKYSFVERPTEGEIRSIEAKERVNFFKTYPMPIWAIVETKHEIFTELDMCYLFVHIYFVAKDN